MRKEILKGLTMLLVVVALAFVSAVVSANAQSTRKIVADVPFEFVVGDQALPSGKYSVKAITASGDGLMIQSNNSKHCVMRLSNRIAPKGNNTEARLVFHRYGDRYFLSEIWSGEDQTGRQLLKSRQERALQRELAAIPSKSEWAKAETVEILATLQ